LRICVQQEGIADRGALFAQKSDKPELELNPIPFCAFGYCAFQAIMWMAGGQWLRGALLAGAGCGYSAHMVRMMGEILIEKR
jgi:hypothetical protein